MGGASGRLKTKVRTATDNRVQTRPFRVHSVTTTTRWDPSEDKLPVRWKINDPNGRIRSGRIRYVVDDDTGKSKDVYGQRLKKYQFEHGKDHELPEAEQWDGTIREGLPNRIGDKVTAELSPVVVIVEVWNNNQPAPAERLRKGKGRTKRQGEWLSNGTSPTEIDAIKKASWDRSFVIPYDMPPQRRNGWVALKISVKNVQEGTSVRVAVDRIDKIDDPLSDQQYWDEFMDDVPQPGLKGLRVRKDKVVRPNGRRPYVRFNNYAEHWKYPGNSFYRFSVAFGKWGESIVATERDYVNKESKCLHLRFTVFIHCTSLKDDYKRCADLLSRFLRKETDYFRPLTLYGNPKTVMDWYRRYRNQYIVVILGHANTMCFHKDHPKKEVGKGKKKRDVRIDQYHRGFWPDHFRCPTGVMDTKSGRSSLKWALKHYKHNFAGCGHSDAISHYMPLGRCRHATKKKPKSPRRRLWLINPYAESTDRCACVLWGSAKTGAWSGIVGKGENPRAMFFAGGCRQMLSRNLGERFTRNGTKYYHAWVWSVWITENTAFCMRFFRRWIKGSKADPAKVEYDVRRLVQCYRDATQFSGVSSHPRLLGGRNIINPMIGVPPPETQKILK